MFLEFELVVEFQVLGFEEGDDFLGVDKFMGEGVNDRGFGMKYCGIGLKLFFVFALAFDDPEGFFFIEFIF